jgi:DNA-binding NtrC family response regulator
VIVLDLLMPDMDGLQVLEQMIAFNPAQQIILLTGHATVSKGVQAIKLGAVDVLEKPVDIRKLVEKIHAVMSAPATNGGEGRPGHPPQPQQECWGQGVLRFLRRLFKREKA